MIAYQGDDTFEEANVRSWALPRREAMNLDPSDYLVDREVGVVDQVL